MKTNWNHCVQVCDLVEQKDKMIGFCLDGRFKLPMELSHRMTRPAKEVDAIGAFETWEVIM
jgi:hypothetical protein